MKEKLTHVEACTTLFQPETLLPAQFFAALRQKARAQGERRLMVAILEDAVECFQKHFWATDNRGRQLHTDAEQWLLSDDTTWLFSFVNICDILGIHPLFLRRGLAQWKAQQFVPNGPALSRSRTRPHLKPETKRGDTQPQPLQTASKI